MTLRYRPGGNLVEDDADVLVCAVNCVGVMGKGVALAFRLKWPEVMGDYRRACNTGEMHPGACFLFPLPDGRRWAALATKDSWRRPSQYLWVDSGLLDLVRELKATGAKSVALPALGCGNGRLEWPRVHQMIARRFESVPYMDVRVYAPEAAMVPA